MASASAVSLLICVENCRCCGTCRADAADDEEGPATGARDAMLVGVVCCSGTGCWMLWSRFEAVLVTAVDATMGGGSWVGGGAAAGVTPTGCVGITMGGAGGLATAVAAGRAVGVAAATSGEVELETAAE